MSKSHGGIWQRRTFLLPDSTCINGIINSKFHTPIICQVGIAYCSCHLITYLPYTNLQFYSLTTAFLRLKYNCNKNNICMPVIYNTPQDYTHLYSINRSSIWIPIAVNNDSTVALVYEVCTSTNIIQIRRSPNPTVQLSDSKIRKRTHLRNKLMFTETNLSRMRDKPNMATMMLSKPLDHSQHLTHILSLSPVRNKGSICG